MEALRVRRCVAIYSFLLHKLHDIRFAEHCRRVAMVSASFKREKATQQALRPKLKAPYGPVKSKPEQGRDCDVGASCPSEGVRAHARANLMARKFTENTFGKLIVRELRQHIPKVGGSLTGQSRAAKRILQDQLRCLVPGIICREDDGPDVDNLDDATISAVDALDGDARSEG